MRRICVAIGVVSIFLFACGEEKKGNTVETDTLHLDTASGDTGDVAVDLCDGLPDGSACDDGDPCTLDDKCAAGLCIGGVNEPCETDNPCEEGTCA